MAEAFSGRGGETEPPNLATEINTGRGVFQARNSQSPVRIRQGSTAKTPRNRGDFSGCAGVRAGSLCGSRLGGGESGIRTHGTFRHTRFPSVRLKPLGHLSAANSFPAPGYASRRLTSHCAHEPQRLGRLAEREGFEPSIGFTLYTLSRGALSATQPPLRAVAEVTASPGSPEKGSRIRGHR